MTLHLLPDRNSHLATLTPQSCQRTPQRITCLSIRQQQ